MPRVKKVSATSFTKESLQIHFARSRCGCKPSEMATRSASLLQPTRSPGSRDTSLERTVTALKEQLNRVSKPESI